VDEKISWVDTVWEALSDHAHQRHPALRRISLVGSFDDRQNVDYLTPFAPKMQLILELFQFYR